MMLCARWVARRRAAALGRDERGHVLIQFGLVAPMFLTLVFGIIEFALIMFLQTMIEGGAREASRFGITGQGISGETREERILNIVDSFTLGFLERDEIQLETLIYDSFESIGEPEPFTDANDSGSYDAGEEFVDINGNGAWDPDMGAAGLGGAGDIVVYRLVYDWQILIPLIRPFFGGKESIRLDANVAVRNEPFPRGT